jgi:hypothetical protein
MEAAVNKAGVSYTDEEINRLTQRHFENLQVETLILLRSGYGQLAT